MQFKKSKMKLNEYIFKVCRVHNIEDLKNIINNGANMIGIHAVILDRNQYLNNEERCSPFNSKVMIDGNLPLATLEIDSIRIMQKYIPKTIKQAILFQQPININLMKECCKLYNMPLSEIYIQLHHRTNKEYIEIIKKEVTKNIIAVTGIFQNDFYEYFWKLHDILDPKTDYILIDLSVHQSDFSIYNNKIDKFKRIKEIVKIINNNKVPIILAEDTKVKVMKKYLKELKKYNINIKGIDMQNSVEIEKSKQKYKILNDGEFEYQAKIRKSEKKLLKWKKFLRRNAHIYFA